MEKNISTVTCVFLKTAGTIVTRRDDGSPRLKITRWGPARQSPSFTRRRDNAYHAWLGCSCDIDSPQKGTFSFKLIPDAEIVNHVLPHSNGQLNGVQDKACSSQPAVPVAKVLERVHPNDYLLPAIQREFVWNTSQIRALFDSVMRGYPMSSFLLWQVSPGHVRDFTFYNFITEYHEKDHPYATKAHVLSGSGLTAVLDGQQRLTAPNIGLYGSHAERLPKQ